MGTDAKKPAGGDTSLLGGAERFPSTRWSRVLGPETATGADLEALARDYWRPVYAFVRRHWGRRNDEAKDRTQEFFAWVLESDLMVRADPGRGRFRAFLKTALRHFLIDEDRRENSLKRGGRRKHLSLDLDDEACADLEPADATLAPDAVLDKLWRHELIERATSRLAEELRAAGRETHYDVFRDYFLQRDTELDYRAVAARYGISTTDVSNYLMYAKRRYREQLIAVVRETVLDADALAAEMRWLFGEEGM